MTNQEALKELYNQAFVNTDNVEVSMTKDCYKTIKLALDKQIPKVPCYWGDGYYNGEIVIDTWECPFCGKQYEVDYEDYKYCPNCGQHIDHSTLTEDD